MLREIPATLAHRIELFKGSAHAYQESHELFRVDSWVQVMLGQGIMPKHYHNSVSMMSEGNLSKFLNSIKMPISEKVSSMPTHSDFINQYCKSE
jgi:tryptophan halogenase